MFVSGKNLSVNTVRIPNLILPLTPGIHFESTEESFDWTFAERMGIESMKPDCETLVRDCIMIFQKPDDNTAPAEMVFKT